MPLFFLLPCRASYAKLYIVFDPDFTDTVDDEVLDAISSQFLFQLGFLLILPIPLLLAVEQVYTAASARLAVLPFRGETSWN